MTRSSLTEETPATPGWVEARVKAIFSAYGDAGLRAGDRYLDCLAGVRGAVDVGSGQDGCRLAALDALREVVADPDALDRNLEALEAAIREDT